MLIQSQSYLLHDTFPWVARKPRVEWTKTAGNRRIFPSIAFFIFFSLRSRATRVKVELFAAPKQWLRNGWSIGNREKRLLTSPTKKFSSGFSANIFLDGRLRKNSKSRCILICSRTIVIKCKMRNSWRAATFPFDAHFGMVLNEQMSFLFNHQ